MGVSPIRYFLGGEGGIIMLSRLCSESVFSNENDVRGEISVFSCRSSFGRIAFSEFLLRSTFDDAGERRNGDRTGKVRVRGPVDSQFAIILS